MTPLQRLIEHARRQQHKQKRGIPSRQSELPLDAELWEEHTRERIARMTAKRESWIDNHTAMRVSRERTCVTWASEQEALEQWRGETDA